MSQMPKQLIYFADPMCSWCWGFAPTIARLLENYGDRLALHMIMGGLRAGNTTPMDTKQKDYIRNHWEHVAERSGQPFDWTFFDRDSFIYDTEPACRAVVVARQLDPNRAHPLMLEIQTAFYAGNKDVTNIDVLTECATAAGVDAGAFRGLFETLEARSATLQDFQTTQQVGIPGFPTLLIGDDGAALTVLANGYQSYDGIAERLEEYLSAPTAGSSEPATSAS